MRILPIIAIGAVICACNRVEPPAETRAAGARVCSDARVTGRLPSEIKEASGIAISRRTPGILWVHGDEPTPVVFAIDSTGAIRGRVRITGAELEDWEDIAAGPCGNESCLYIGDIGDNDEIRGDAAIYRVVEPLPTDSATAPAVRLPFRFPDRARDAESLFVAADGRIFLITKGRSGAVGLYGLPQSAASDVQLEAQALAVLHPGPLKMPDMITGAGATPDGRFVAVRSYDAFGLYRFRNGELAPVPGGVFDVRELPEGLGEGIDIRNDGVVFLVSEVSTDGRGSPVSRVQCRLPSD